MQNKLLENIALATSTNFLWLLFFAVVILTSFWSLIFAYHWYHYHTDKKMFIVASSIYGLGLSLLLILNIITIFIFNNA